MKYYQVKKEADQKRRIDGSIYIANELYTIKEAERMKLNIDYMDLIEANEKDTYTFFGARMLAGTYK